MRSPARLSRAVSTRAIKLWDAAGAWCTSLRHTSSRAGTEGTVIRAQRDVAPSVMTCLRTQREAATARLSPRAHDPITVFTQEWNDND